MRDYYTLKINLLAGIVSPAALQTILTAAQAAHVRKVRFGSRQQLLMTVHYEDLRQLEKNLCQQAVPFEVNTDRHPNIISSYCGEEVFRTGSWLREGEYHTVLDNFGHQPRLKVNLSDSEQSFTPFFTGNLNFIASSEPHFWQLYVRPKQSNALFQWPDLIYTNDVGRLAEAVEIAMLDDGLRELGPLHQAVNTGQTFITQSATQPVPLPEFSLPYYEGFNRYGSRTWLGLYRRNEEFTIAFLLDLCALCLKTRIGEVCVTPWKSLIIKGISEEDRPKWSLMLGRHNSNVRHAANELAWQTEDDSDAGAAIKRGVLRYFERNDTRTFGLCFGVQTRPKSERSGVPVFGSILIRKRPWIRVGSFAFLSLYDLYFTENFNPNSRTYFRFDRGLFWFSVPVQIDRLCRKFSAQRLIKQQPVESPERIDSQLIVSKIDTSEAYQCPHCLTVYDPESGDDRAGVLPGVAFADLPGEYGCATCDAPKRELVGLVLAG